MNEAIWVVPLLLALASLGEMRSGSQFPAGAGELHQARKRFGLEHEPHLRRVTGPGLVIQQESHTTSSTDSEGNTSSSTDHFITYSQTLPEFPAELKLIREGQESVGRLAEGVREETTGDPDFDDMFWIETSNRQAAQIYLTPQRQQTLVHIFHTLPEASIVDGVIRGRRLDGAGQLAPVAEALPLAAQVYPDTSLLPRRQPGWLLKAQLWRISAKLAALAVVSTSITGGILHVSQAAPWQLWNHGQHLWSALSIWFPLLGLAQLTGIVLLLCRVPCVVALRLLLRLTQLSLLAALASALFTFPYEGGAWILGLFVGVFLLVLFVPLCWASIEWIRTTLLRVHLAPRRPEVTLS